VVVSQLSVTLGSSSFRIEILFCSFMSVYFFLATPECRKPTTISGPLHIIAVPYGIRQLSCLRHSSCSHRLYNSHCSHSSHSNSEKYLASESIARTYMSEKHKKSATDETKHIESIILAKAGGRTKANGYRGRGL